MDIVEAKRVLAKVKFPGFSFFIHNAFADGEPTYLQAAFDAFDNDRPGVISRQLTRKWLLSRHMTRSELVQTAFKCVLTSVEHDSAPKAQGQITGIWMPKRGNVIGATSYVDGLANTRAMADAGSPVAQQALACRIAGFDDWHIGARDQVELQYRHHKPTKQINAGYFRDGDNPSSYPAGYRYSSDMPLQTLDPLFQEGGAEAFDSMGYWTSTQYSADYAWYQHFNTGYQSNSDKSWELGVKFVRRFFIGHLILR
ncbi:MAG: DUF1566 domain-containing protein [Ramlibacter sp.]|nr:DUF1566 domain-containing protein [Ramlibacter sp.]